jgi:uncharacterized protein YbjT (DUF2867 family)
MILITGATGNIGTELVKRLSGSGEPIRAFVRSRTQAQTIDLPGIDLVAGDFAEPKTFTPALQNVDRLFLLIPSSSEVEQQQRNFVDAAKRSKIKHIVKLSQLGADEKAPGRFQRYHGAVEKYIQKSDIPYTFLRPNLFMQGLLNFRATITSQGVFYAPAGNAKVSVVDVRDIASVASRVLTESGHEGKAYDITGPQALTHAEMADQLSQAAGKPIKYVDVPPDTMRQALLGFGMPAWQAEGLVEDYDHYRRGEAGEVTQIVRDVTGSEATSYSKFAKDYVGRLLGKAAGAS